MENIFDSWLTKTPIAHRGLHNAELPENSLAAFENAVKNGYPIEMDVQVTKDGVPLVFHDDLLDRMTDHHGDIREKNFHEICDATLKNSEEKIPLLTEFLRHVNGKVPVLVEIKDHKHIGKAEEAIKEILDGYRGQVAVQSFNPFIVKWFKQNTLYPVGQLSSFFTGVPMAGWKKAILKNLLLLKYSKADFISYECHDGSEFEKLQGLKGKLPILFWTVQSRTEAENFKNKCDNIIFENFLPPLKTE